jgi:hypothetical protein
MTVTKCHHSTVSFAFFTEQSFLWAVVNEATLLSCYKLLKNKCDKKHKFKNSWVFVNPKLMSIGLQSFSIFWAKILSFQN